MRTDIFALAIPFPSFVGVLENGFRGENMVKITLSRRNLETLLAQLDLIKIGDREAIAHIVKSSKGTLIQVNGEEDEVHYAGGQFGLFTDAVEAIVKRYRATSRRIVAKVTT